MGVRIEYFKISKWTFSAPRLVRRGGPLPRSGGVVVLCGLV
ncbi:hypothetical protein [Parabacteroides sp. PF5-9]|nr:hypothetical protein [Parabacteroides sp. PF5-9]MDH6357286.1 hypothetical protein [Parabacteroides sp. PF5-9]